MKIATIGSFSFQISDEKALQIKSLQVLFMCQKKGFSYTLPEIEAKFRLCPNVSSVMMFEQIVSSEMMRE